MSDDDKKMSLADKLRAQKEAKEAEAAADKPMTLAEKLRAKKEAEAAEGKPMSLAERLKAQHGDDDDEDDGGDDLPEEDALALQTEIDTLKSTFSELAGKVRLTELAAEITQLGSQAVALPAAIQAVREKGYAYRSYLENKADVLKEQWDEMDEDLKHWVQEEAEDLKDDFEQTQRLVARLSALGTTTKAQAILGRVKTAVEMLDDKVTAAENHINTQYNNIRREVDQTNRQINEISWFLEMRDEATFDFGAAEEVFLVAKAEWDDGQDKPDGLLFLTNQRLVFEQKEKTGKRFGMFGGKDTQGILWEAAISSVEEVTAENKGLLGGKDMVNMTLGAGAPYAKITVEVKGGVDCKFWAKQINRMATGNADDERAIPPDPELIERLKNAPTDCHVCGGVLPKIVAGQAEVTCPYCGTVIRI